MDMGDNMPKSGEQEQAIDRVVGERIRQRRVALGLSQSTIGESLDLTFQQVQKMEKGVNRVGAGRLWQIAILLGVPVAYFYEGLHKRTDDGDPEAKINYAAANYFLSRREGQKMAAALHEMDPLLRGAFIRLVLVAGEQTNAHRNNNRA